MNPFDASIDKEIHEHLEIQNVDTTLTISVFDVPSIDQFQMNLCRTDNLGKLDFNSYKIYLSKDQFKELSNFFSDIQRKIYIRNSHKFIEEFRENLYIEEERQIDFIKSDNDHIDLNTPNLFRDVMDSDTIKNKMRASKVYCKKFYAAMCNTDLYKVGSTGEYGYSWRSAGGLVADILGEGDYLNWYCSGNEGFVDDEITDDLNAIGWVAVPMEVGFSVDSQQKLL